MCLFPCFCHFWNALFFPGGWCHTKWPAEGKGMGNVNGAQCKSGNLLCTRCLTYCQRNTYTKQGENNPLDLMLKWYLCALCTIHLACEKKIACLLIFFVFPPYLNSLLYEYSVIGQFHFEHDRNAFPFCWKITAFQTVVIVWHSVVGGHVMVCVAQPLGLLVRTYKIVFIWARTFLLTIKQPSSYKMCQLLLL